jgi:urease accessory protein UreE
MVWRPGLKGIAAAEEEEVVVVVVEDEEVVVVTERDCDKQRRKGTARQNGWDRERSIDRTGWGGSGQAERW